MTYKGFLFRKNKREIGISQNENQIESDQRSINEKHVKINLYIENAKADPNETLSDEYTNKVIILGYIMVMYKKRNFLESMLNMI